MGLVVREEDVAYGLRLALSKKEQKEFIEIMKKQHNFFGFFTQTDRSIKKDIKDISKIDKKRKRALKEYRRWEYNKYRICFFFLLGALFSADRMRFPVITLEDIKKVLYKNMDETERRITRLEREVEECISEIKEGKNFSRKKRQNNSRDRREKIDNLNPIFKVFMSGLLPGGNPTDGFAISSIYLLADIFLQKADLEETEDEEKKQIIAEAEEILREREN